MSSLYIETQRQKQLLEQQKLHARKQFNQRVSQVEEKGNSGYDWNIMKVLSKREKKDKTVSNVLSRDDADNEYTTMLSNFGIGLNDTIRQYAYEVLGTDSDAYNVRLLTRYTEEILNRHLDTNKKINMQKIEVY